MEWFDTLIFQDGGQQARFAGSARGLRDRTPPDRMWIEYGGGKSVHIGNPGLIS